MTKEVDILHRFSFVDLPIRGQWVRLEEVLAHTHAGQAYPGGVDVLLAQMLAAVSMFADNLKFDGAVALQSKGDGRLTRTLAECRQQQHLRGIAHLNSETPAQAPAAKLDLANWLGNGQLALSLIPTADEQSNRLRETYQGMIALDQPTLAGNLENYFHISEQLPTRLYFSEPQFASAQEVHQQGSAPARISQTALLIQRLPPQDNATEIALATHDEAWHTIQTLADTVTTSELETLSAQKLLGRLFAEYNLNLHPGRELNFKCTCSRQKTDQTLKVLSRQELEQLLQELGEIGVDCEFCGTTYKYDAIDISHLHSNSPTHSNDTLH